ncbi:MAG: hypothetical protein Q9163_001737 [Psora crenata]
MLSLIPREVLEERLGYDIPPMPEVSVAGIGSRSVLLYWLNPKEVGFAAVTLSVFINGVKLGEFSRGETSIELLNLNPKTCYNIKIMATNIANLSTITPAIQVQTLEATASDTIIEGDEKEPAAIRTSFSCFGSQTLQLAVKEGGCLEQTATRTPLARRHTSIGHLVDGTIYQAPPSRESDEDVSPQVIHCLTERLENLKKQKEEVDKQIEDEEAEAKVNHADLARERDHLKQELKEKEDASAELRRHGNHLDKLNRMAQSKKAAKEKLLQQKRAEREKIKDDSQRWDREVVEMRYEIEEMNRELESVNSTRDREVTLLRQAIMEDQDTIKSLEEEIRITGARAKELEQRREQIETEGGVDQERAKADRERDVAWEARYQNMQAQLGSIWQALQRSKVEEQGAEEHLSWWLARRARNPEQFIPLPAMDLHSKVSRTRSMRSRQANSRGSNISYQGYYGGQSTYGCAPPPYSSSSSLFPIGNSIALDNGVNQVDLAQTDIKVLTGGAPMSPAADDLLPSNLFRDEDTIFQPSIAMNTDNVGIEHFIGHAISNSDASARGLHTPISAGSPGGSVFTSPHNSMHNLPGYPPESDRQSINSGNAPTSTSLNTDNSTQGTSRFANLFSSPFGRQRGKSSSHEPPLLSTLKQAQSQSFPRNQEQDNFDLAGARRRKGSHGSWTKPMAGLLARNSGNSSDGLIRARTDSWRTSRPNMFKPRMDSLDPGGIAGNEPSRSRPSSTYSFDQIFGSPSNDGHRVWGQLSESPQNRISPLGGQWASSHGPWSKAPSRRSSVQHGSSTNLSLGSTPLDAEGLSSSLLKHRPEQAPIGTRPKSQRGATPKLNPAAPSFKTLFGRGEARKAAKTDKVSSKHLDTPKETDGERGASEGTELDEDASPPNPRLSRDAHSITTATSTADSHESFERTTSGAASDATTPSGHKESFIQKISRKSSSSMFNVPWAKDRGMFSKRAGEPSTPGEVDEDISSEGQLTNSVASTPHTPQERTGRAWPSMRRKSRKGEIVEKGNEIGDEND